MIKTRGIADWRMCLESKKYLPWSKVPNSWLDRTSGEGYTRKVTSTGERIFADNGDPVSTGFRPCAKCGEFPTSEGHDACLGELGKVMNACCGHGRTEGYIQFDCGIIIRGKFTVERWRD